MTPQSRETTAKTAVFRHRWQAWKVVRSIAAVGQRPRTPRNRRCSFAFFEAFLWHFNKKQRAEVIFRLSRPVSCKNQENGSGKRWSLHAPLKWFGTTDHMSLVWNYITIIEIENRKSWWYQLHFHYRVSSHLPRKSDWIFACFGSLKWQLNGKPSEVEETYIRQFVSACILVILLFFQLFLLLLW